MGVSKNQGSLRESSYNFQHFGMYMTDLPNLAIKCSSDNRNTISLFRGDCRIRVYNTTYLGTSWFEGYRAQDFGVRAIGF